MIAEQERKRRRLKYRLIQLVLVALTLGIGVAFWSNRRGNVDVDVRRERDVTFTSDVPTQSQLAPGDMQLFNEDRTIDLILQGPHIHAGLSPQTVERVRSKIRNSGPDDSSGIAGLIASTVKEQVADKIGTHVRYDVADIREIRLEGERLVIEWKSGKQQQIFESVKIEREEANRFRPDEARRFIELVKLRQEQLRNAPSSVIVVPLPKRP